MEWQAARAANRRSLVVRTLQACRSWPVGELRSAASPLPRLRCPQRRLLSRLARLPAGIDETGAPPLRGRDGRCCHSDQPAPEPGPLLGGSLPSTSQRPASARQQHRQAHNLLEVRRIAKSRGVTEKAFVGAHTLGCRCAPPVRARNLLIHAQNPPPAMRVDPQVAKPWWRAAASKKRRLSRGGGSSKAKELPQGALMTRHDDAIALGIVRTMINNVIAIA